MATPDPDPNPNPHLTLTLTLTLALTCSTKWKPVVSMPVKALDEPPCFCRKALKAPSSG